ncbi:MAG: hypothetical protein HC796_08060 [Synechococcaceae cyanobacterium RL_1_2]|nr:hypothetical protein [Synechococcaceae cyanobacterium RL_1_2]
MDLPSGLMVSFYDEEQYALIFDNLDPGTWEELPLTDTSIIRGIVVKNPQYRTAEGFGPGTLLSKGTQYYGEATLSYNWEIEGREYISFAKGLLGNEDEVSGIGISMRSNQGTLTQFSGIYPEEVNGASFQETNLYHDHGAINSIEIMTDL